MRQITYSACPPAQGVEQPTKQFCRDHNDEMLAAIASDPHVRHVVLATYYSYTSTAYETFAAGLEASVATLRESGKQVIISYPLPETTVDMPMILARRMMLGHHSADIRSYESFREDFTREFALVNQLKGEPGVVAVPTYERFCDQQCSMADENGVYFFDRHHLSMYGARQLTPLYHRWLSSTEVPESQASVRP